MKISTMKYMLNERMQSWRNRYWWPRRIYVLKQEVSHYRRWLVVEQNRPVPFREPDGMVWCHDGEHRILSFKDDREGEFFCYRVNEA